MVTRYAREFRDNMFIKKSTPHYGIPILYTNFDMIQPCLVGELERIRRRGCVSFVQTNLQSF